jgi:release factor glutamine methyltransferase
MTAGGKEPALRTFRKLLRMGEEFLAKADVPEPEVGAWYLFAYCFHISRAEFFLRSEEPTGENAWEEYKLLLEKRAARIPLEHITHETEFMGLPFYVDENVLIPRQDTECLVEEVLKKCEGKRVLDMCAGSGCIGISLAALGKCETVVLADISAEALRVAEKNAADNGVRVTCIESDLFQHITGKFDIIVSNPPYIRTGEIPSLMPEVREHDPVLALDGKEDGLAFYRRIVTESRRHLEMSGMLCFEIGYNQAEAVKDLMKQSGFGKIEVKKDLAGLDRIVIGSLKMEEIYV